MKTNREREIAKKTENDLETNYLTKMCDGKDKIVEPNLF